MRRVAGVVALLLAAACQPLDTPPADRAPSGDAVVAVVGDSVGWSLGWGVEPVDGVELHLGAGLGCGLDAAPVLVGDRPHQEPGLPVPCAEHPERWRATAADADPDVVVLVLGAWEVYDRLLPDGTVLRVGTEPWRAWLDGRLEAVGTALALAAPHATLAVADVPCFAERGPDLGGAASPRNDPAARAAVDERLSAFVARHPARVVDLPWAPWLCGPGAAARPDGIHLTAESARVLWSGPLGAFVRGLR